MEKLYEEFPFLLYGADAIPEIAVLFALFIFFLMIEAGVEQCRRSQKEREHDIHRFVQKNKKGPNTS